MPESSRQPGQSCGTCRLYEPYAGPTGAEAKHTTGWCKLRKRRTRQHEDCWCDEWKGG